MGAEAAYIPLIASGIGAAANYFGQSTQDHQGFTGALAPQNTMTELQSMLRSNYDRLSSQVNNPITDLPWLQATQPGGNASGGILPFNIGIQQSTPQALGNWGGGGGWNGSLTPTRANPMSTGIPDASRTPVAGPVQNRRPPGDGTPTGEIAIPRDPRNPIPDAFLNLPTPTQTTAPVPAPLPPPTATTPVPPTRVRTTSIPGAVSSDPNMVKTQASIKMLQSLFAPQQATA